MCHAELPSASTASGSCSSWSQCVGWGRLRAPHRGVGHRRRKQGIGDGAPCHRARFEGADRRVHMGKLQGRSDGRMGEMSVLPQRKRRPWPSASVPKRPLQLPRQRPGLALPSVASGAARSKAPALSRPQWGRNRFKREARRSTRRTGRCAERGRSGGRTRASAFVPPINLLAVAAGELEEALLEPLPEEEEAIP